jgi:hypothetical protein
MNSVTHKKRVATSRLVTITQLMALSILMAGCTIYPRSYSAAPIGGRVIDRETGQPIAGAYVVATYVLKMGMTGGASTPLHYEETRTDHEGRFHFNGFDKIRVPYPRAAKNATLRNEDPSLHFFAEGYHPDRLGRDPLLASRTYPLHHRVSILDGRDFGLRPFADTPLDEQIRDFANKTDSLGTTISGGYPDPYKKPRCIYHKIPRTIHFLRELSFQYLEKSKKRAIEFYVPEQLGCEWRTQ